MDKLPIDIIAIIFSKLPVKTLLGLKCVCKPWSQIIDGEVLAEIHLNGGIEEPNILLLSKSDTTSDQPRIRTNWREDGNILEIGSNVFADNAKHPKAYILESSCNGILCFKKKYGLDRTAYLLNPFRKEALELPAPSSLSQPGLAISYGLGFDRSTRRCKIVRVVAQRCETEHDETNQICFNLTAEIYTLGLNSSWRTLSSGPPCPVFGRSVFAAGGILYWVGLAQIMSSNHPENYDDIDIAKIVAFDVAMEEFRLISCPGWVLCFHLVDLGGVLGIVDCSSSTHIEIWTLKDNERENWVKEYRIEIRAPDGLFCNSDVEVIGLWKKGEVLMKYCQSFISYNPRNDTLKYINIPSGDSDEEVCSFTGSLVSLSSFKAR